jgi:hypothetical protein
VPNRLCRQGIPRSSVHVRESLCGNANGKEVRGRLTTRTKTRTATAHSLYIVRLSFYAFEADRAWSAAYSDTQLSFNKDVRSAPLRILLRPPLDECCKYIYGRRPSRFPFRRSTATLAIPEAISPSHPSSDAIRLLGTYRFLLYSFYHTSLSLFRIFASRPSYYLTLHTYNLHLLSTCYLHLALWYYY